ncbi:L-iditol 2-dehydrogenase [Abditibacterium utsteinense]|uniref:L-iditol 2-dehydrogenase n=1 Tax=Abditibacterium utsteinense TaxID=1960156 RepID=A0A2S8SXE3_9BACT|nr:NAD(P)-dependent alcohol dehydrogenase [Abditibacterium utsteinense]PQV65470.1 L-iditol 2-dehydrogenase [Abditibacterium utsteinense]
MSKTMSAAVLHGTQDLRVEQVPVPQAPARGEVQIRIEKVGICGSDVHYYQHGRIGDFVVEAPMILGHECAGTVERVGEGISHLQIGDRVAIEPGVPRLSNALSHFYMKRGQYNLCPDIFFFATPPDNGSFCELVNHRADFCFKLPENVTLEEGALIEPLSTGIYAARVAPVTMGDTVVITGAGPIGLMNLLACQAAGAANVVISDQVAARLNVARQIGATRVVLGEANELKSIARELTDGRGADVCIECAGHPSALKAAIGAARAGGVVVLVGMPVGDMADVNINDLIVREITLRPIFRYNNTFPTGVDLIASGKVDVKPLISKRFALKDVPEAFEYVIANREKCVKAIVSL